MLAHRVTPRDRARGGLITRSDVTRSGPARLASNPVPDGNPVTEPSRLRRIVRAAWPWLLVAATFLLWTFGRPGGDGLSTDAVAPTLELPWTGEGRFDLAAQRGHVTVLTFWATWCPACRAEAPTLSRVHARIAPRGDAVIGVSADRGALEPVAARARQLGMRYPIALATRADLDRFEVDRLPTIYVIDGAGRVRETFIGAVGEARLLEAVEAAR